MSTSCRYPCCCESLSFLFRLWSSPTPCSRSAATCSLSSSRRLLSCCSLQAPTSRARACSARSVACRSDVCSWRRSPSLNSLASAFPASMSAPQASVCAPCVIHSRSCSSKRNAISSRSCAAPLWLWSNSLRESSCISASVRCTWEARASISRAWPRTVSLCTFSSSEPLLSISSAFTSQSSAASSPARSFTHSLCSVTSSVWSSWQWASKAATDSSSDSSVLLDHTLSLNRNCSAQLLSNLACTCVSEALSLSISVTLLSTNSRRPLAAVACASRASVWRPGARCSGQAGSCRQRSGGLLWVLRSCTSPNCFTGKVQLWIPCARLCSRGPFSTRLSWTAP
mmetsp:Transcript_21026/g.48824  ORF Transcript_21026/g.48824 Transcript_21026/m.48824 type:complete len:341 (-) Transcript_21026:359-1381(-)